MRIASIVDGLRHLGPVHVACLSPGLEEETRQWIRERGCTIASFTRRRPGPVSIFRQRMQMLFSFSNLVRHPDEQEFFNRQYAAVRPNIVWLETPYLLRYALPWKNQAPLVVDYFGTAEGAYREFQAGRGWRKIWDGLRWLVSSAAERRYSRQVPNILAVHQGHADYFSKTSPAARVWSIPIAKPANLKPVQIPPARKVKNPETMIMTGDFSFRPNIDAARYFAESIFPRIREAVPTARFHLVGNTPAPEVKALEKIPGILVKGFVPDLAAELAAAGIFVLPLRLGSGFRTKLLDALSAGMPLVTTAAGAEGLALENERSCLMADTPDAFSAACLRLLREPETRDRLGQAAARLGREIYTPEYVGRRLRELVQSVTAC
jgi:glycosyltransferase involved in cell wall biosynthesis